MQIVVKVEDLSDARDHCTGHDCGGGYATDDTVYVDSRLPDLCQMFVLFHEVIEWYVKHSGRNRIRHKDYDIIAQLLIDALLQWGKHDTT